MFVLEFDCMYNPFFVFKVDHIMRVVLCREFQLIFLCSFPLEQGLSGEIRLTVYIV